MAATARSRIVPMLASSAKILVGDSASKISRGFGVVPGEGRRIVGMLEVGRRRLDQVGRGQRFHR